MINSMIVIHMTSENTFTITDIRSTPPDVLYPNYKYCVWLLPQGNYWYNINKSIVPHMSVKTHLNLSDALNLHSALKKSLNHRGINVLMDRKFVIDSNNNGFTALEYMLYYSADNIKKKPEWWPENAHMSFIYKYNQDISENEKKYMKKCVNRSFLTFGNPCIVLCKGHHTKWEFVKTQQ